MKLFFCYYFLDEFPGYNTGDLLYTSKSRFNAFHEKGWLNDPVCEQMVRDIDKTEHINDYVYDSPCLGRIGPERLSGGVKGLMLIYKDLEGCRNYALNIWGDNCAEWLLHLSRIRDFTLVIYNRTVWPYGLECDVQTQEGQIITNSTDLNRYLTAKALYFNREEEPHKSFWDEREIEDIQFEEERLETTQEEYIYTEVLNLVENMINNGRSMEAIALEKAQGKEEINEVIARKRRLGLDVKFDTSKIQSW